MQDLNEAKSDTDSKGMKIAAGCVLGAAVAAAVGYGAFLYWQGAEFDKVVSNPEAYLGENMPPLAVRIDKKSLFQRDFTLGLKSGSGEAFQPLLQGVAAFGLHPKLTASVSDAADGNLGELLKLVKPQINADFSWRGTPQGVNWVTEPFNVTEEGALLSFGAVKGVTSFAENAEGKKALSALNTEMTMASFSAAADDEVFTVGPQKVTLQVRDKGPDYIDLAYDVKNVKAENVGDLTRGTLEDGHFKITLDGTAEQLTQRIHWDASQLKAKFGLVPLKVQNFTGSMNLFMPNNPEMLGFAASFALGDKACELFPKFCPKGAEALDDNVFFNSFRDGKSWLELDKSTLATKDWTLGADGLFRVKEDDAKIGALNLNLKLANTKGARFLINLLPRGVYRKEGDALLSTLTLRIEDGNLVLRAEDVEITRF
jgi:hypothetical protein